MARKFFNRNYYDHDDRGSGSAHNIRKVSFMNGVGRIRKHKHQEQFIQLGDDDVPMQDSSRKSWKRGGSRRNKARARSPVVRGPNKGQGLRPSDWYCVKIPYGVKYDKNTLLQLILNHISPNIFIPNSYSNVGNDVVFYVDDMVTAQMLNRANRQIVLSDGHLMQIRVREGVPPPIPIDEKLKEKIKSVMAKRYVAENKALNLTQFAADPDFLPEIHCPLSRPAIMKVVWQIISENISDLVAINLSNNKITVMEESLSVEIKKLKNLKILHLAENNIKSLHTLNCFKDSELTELVLKKNPINKFFKDNAHFVSEVRKKFPKLTKLDDIELPPVISFDVTDEAKLPTPQAAYICNPNGRDIVKAFLSQYFALYDSDNRLELAQAYHDNSTFSLCAFYQPNQKTTTRLNNYIHDSRNLFRVQDYPRRKSKLKLGKQAIVQFLTQLPKTQHDLSSFTVDLTLFTPAFINLCVNGVFREPNTSTVAKLWPVRHFSRTFLIVPVGQGFCIINDMLSVTCATSKEIECSFKESQDAAVLQSPTAAGATTSNDLSNVMASVQSLQLTEPVRIQMVETLATRTGMNLEWSKKCLDETQWDFDRALWTFGELHSKGTIPREAFVK